MQMKWKSVFPVGVVSGDVWSVASLSCPVAVVLLMMKSNSMIEPVLCDGDGKNDQDNDSPNDRLGGRERETHERLHSYGKTKVLIKDGWCILVCLFLFWFSFVSRNFNE